MKKYLLLTIFTLLSFKLFSADVLCFLYPIGWENENPNSKILELTQWETILIENSEVIIPYNTRVGFSTSLLINQDLFRAKIFSDNVKDFNGNIFIDLNTQIPIFFIMPDSLDLNSLRISNKSNSLIFHFENGEKLFSPSDAIISNDSFLGLSNKLSLDFDAPRFDITFNASVRDYSNHKEYKIGDFFGYAESPFAYLFVHHILIEKEVIPILIEFNK